MDPALILSFITLPRPSSQNFKALASANAQLHRAQTRFPRQMPWYPATNSSRSSYSHDTFQVLTQLLACQLGGLGNALWLPLNLECSVMITQNLTSSQPRTYFLTVNLGDYCLHHNQPSISGIKATAPRASTP
ncbi:unnamed protein product [Prunus armeniaca]